MSEIGFGIIGCGNIATIHAKAIQAIPEARLKAFYSHSQPKAERMAQQYQAECKTSLERFLEHKDIQVVSICTPSGTHAELGIKVAAAGKHVVVEKPIDVTLENAQMLIAACQQARVKLAVIFQSRFLPSVQILRNAIDRGRLGQLIMGDAYVKWFRTREYYEAARWRGTLALDGGGALINQSIHTIDLLQYFAGPVASVFGFAEKKLHPYIEAEDTAVAVLKFKNGALGVIEGATSIRPGFSRRVEIHGEKGSVTLDGNDITAWKVADTDEEEEQLFRLKERDLSNGASDPMALDINGHRRQIEDLIEAIRQDRPPMIDGTEGLKALELVLAIYRSARDKVLVEL
ncbi:MAG: Gfo/Idh/MocA family oxidoreductase [Acidobacteria bacterium]|nr:Gfo/Idh/MocA family oxidoreductase [Acidobacteriota bacterium]MCI0720478.1 Gfo/Idh/MocA family oxidoreductase [Acidobacteriota bacterium]